MNDVDRIVNSDTSAMTPTSISSPVPVPSMSSPPTPAPPAPPASPASPSPSPRPLTYVALVALAALMVISLALVPTWFRASLPTAGGTPSMPAGRTGLPPGLLLALAKVSALAWLFARVRRRDVYTTQWSSMFILLFFAEGVVRATSDPSPTAAIGFGEALFAALYFGVVLAILRPLKRQARARQVPR